MAFDLSGKPISNAVLTISRHGVPHADVGLVEAADIAPGTAVTLSIGDVVMVGTVTGGGTVAGEARYGIVGGAAGWQKAITALTYADDNGVTLAQVAADLAAECGETITGAEAKAVGSRWLRPAGVASTALRELVGDRWYVGLDGVTYLTTRPVATTPAAGSVVVESYDMTTGRAVLSAEDDGVSRFMPGSLIASAVLPSSVIVMETVLRVSRESVRAEVLSQLASPLAAMVLDIVRALTRWTVFHGLYAYAVLDDSTDPTGSYEHEHGITTLPAGVVNLRNVSGVAGLPDALSIPKAHGMPGAWSKMAAGTLALVGFRDGSPGQPYVALYLPSQPTPIDIGMDATSSITLGTPGGAVALAKKAEVNVALQAVWTGCGGVGPPPSISGTSKLKGE